MKSLAMCNLNYVTKNTDSEMIWNSNLFTIFRIKKFEKLNIRSGR